MAVRTEAAAGVRRLEVCSQLTAGLHLRAAAMAEVGAQVAVRRGIAAALGQVVRAAQTERMVRTALRGTAEAQGRAPSLNDFDCLD